MFAQQIVPIHYIWTQVQQIDAATAAAAFASLRTRVQESATLLRVRLKMLRNHDKLDSRGKGTGWACSNNEICFFLKVKCLESCLQQIESEIERICSSDL